jgi:hypothetical protein
MRKLIITMLLLMVVGSLKITTAAGGPHLTRTEPQNLAGYVGKYPSELVKGAPALKRRLRVLLGASYGLFMERLQTEMPIENDGGALVARGCMAHSCGEEEAIMVIDLTDGKLHCAILSAKFGGKFKVFSEDKANIPGALNRAIRDR